MRIVLDTNVLLSGLLSPSGPPGNIVRLITTGTVRVCYDARILVDYRQVLLRPAFPFTEIQVIPCRINWRPTETWWQPFLRWNACRTRTTKSFWKWPCPGMPDTW